MKPIEYIGPAPRRKKKRRGPFGGWFLLVVAVGIGFLFVRPLVPFLKAQQSQASGSNVELAKRYLCASGNSGAALAAEALDRTLVEVSYDPAYYSMPYPGGDLPGDKGVCADVVVRSYRGLGVDLQRLVHEDMTENFRLYPQFWRLKGPDPNIDHRRVPNLQRFFARHGQDLEIGKVEDEFALGDVVAWRLPFGENGKAASHVGIVVPGPGARKDEKWVVHNIGAGPEWEDELFSYEIVGHYRFVPEGGFAMKQPAGNKVVTATE